MTSFVHGCIPNKIGSICLSGNGICFGRLSLKCCLNDFCEGYGREGNGAVFYCASEGDVVIHVSLAVCSLLD